MWGPEISSLIGILWLCLDWFIFLQLSIQVLGYVIFSPRLSSLISWSVVFKPERVIGAKNSEQDGLKWEYRK